MSSFMTTEKIYELLPAFYRLRDSEEGLPLKALIEVIARETGIVEDDINQLYKNWFIETCAEWAVPYIGDLLEVRGLHELEDVPGFSRRAFVANTLSYRRRKGTAPVLEQLAFDTTGWRARVVEFFQLLQTTQHINHYRPHNVRTPDLRSALALELIDTPFDSAAHTADVRNIDSSRGKHNIGNIGLFLWRLQSYPIPRVSAAPVLPGPKIPVGCYTLNPLGIDMPLYNRPQAETIITHLAEEVNVPGPLRRRPLAAELESRRNPYSPQPSPLYAYFDDRENSPASPVIQVYLSGKDDGLFPEDFVQCKPEELVICHLDPWHPAPMELSYSQLTPGDPGTIQTETRPIKAAVDPLNGRLVVSDPAAVKKVLVSYSYAFGGDVGGGPYNRRASMEEAIKRPVIWQVGVSTLYEKVAGETIYKNLADAVDDWNAQPPGTAGMITIMDNSSYHQSLTGTHKIDIPEGSHLIIAAANWPKQEVEDGVPGQKKRALGRFSAKDVRPHIAGNISVKGTASPLTKSGGTLVLNGLLIDGKVTVLAGNLGDLHLVHCTLVPGKGGVLDEPPGPTKGSLVVNGQNEHLDIHMERCITGPIHILPAVSGLTVKESIVDNGSNPANDTFWALLANETPIQLVNVTVMGSLDARSVQAENSIFTGLLKIQRRQTGCVRFSFVPPGSVTPRLFRCQPQLEIEIQTQQAQKHSETMLTPGDKNSIKQDVVEHVFPSFTSRSFGSPAFGQLSRHCHAALKTGADDGAEMGVFYILKQPQREANLRNTIDEYLPFGMNAGLFFVT